MNQPKEDDMGLRLAHRWRMWCWNRYWRDRKDTLLGDWAHWLITGEGPNPWPFR